MIEIEPTKFWCNSCGNKFNNNIISLRLSEDNNASSFVLCENCLNKLDKMIRRL